MPRESKLRYWAKRNVFYANINRKRYYFGPDEEKAKKKFHKKMSETPRRVSVDADTVAAIVDSFLDHAKRELAPRTASWYDMHLQSFLNSLSDQKLTLTVEELKPKHVTDWLKLHPKWGPSNRHGAVVAVKRSLNYAVEQEVIPFSPIRHMKRPRPERRETYVTEEEHQTIMAKRKNAFRTLCEIAWETGARPHEIRTIEAKWIDLVNARWVFPIAKSKGKKIPRVVHLSKRAIEICREGIKKNPNGPIFRTNAGTPWERDTINTAFCRLKKVVGRKLCLYAYRHGFATRLLTQGHDCLTVAILLGHRDPSQLAKTYQHISQRPDVLHQALENKKAG